MRAVLDPNVFISAALSPSGSPAELLRRWLSGAFEVVVSDAILDELARALGYRKLRRRIAEPEAGELLALLRRAGSLHPDPTEPPSVVSPDPGDDYLVALAESTGSALVSGDGHLLSLANAIPVYSPAQFLVLLDAAERR